MNTARMRGRRQGMKLWHVSEAELLTYLLTYLLSYLLHEAESLLRS